MSDVSCHALVLYFEALEALGLPDSELMVGSSLSLEAVKRPSHRIPWDDFVGLTERMGKLLGTERALVELGASFLGMPTYRAMGRLLRMVVRPCDLYRLATGLLGSRMFRVPVIDLQSHSANDMTVSLTIPEPYLASPAYLRINEGVLSAFTLAMDLPRAEVSPEYSEDGRRGVYEVSVSARRADDEVWKRQRWALLRAVWRPPGSAQTDSR